MELLSSYSGVDKYLSALSHDAETGTNKLAKYYPPSQSKHWNIRDGFWFRARFYVPALQTSNLILENYIMMQVASWPCIITGLRVYQDEVQELLGVG